MRLIAAAALTQQAVGELSAGSSTRLLVFAVIRIVLAILLVPGLWTPIAAALVAVMQLWNGQSGPGALWFHILLATLGVALALLGPGAWSVDARLFGWKRIDIGDRKG